MKTIPMAQISSILNEVMEQAVANGANSISMPDAYVAVAHFLSFPEQYAVQPVSGAVDELRLPKCAALHGRDLDSLQVFYTADQMHEYASAAIKLSRAQQAPAVSDQIDEAARLAALYNDDGRPDIKTDVMNAFYRGVAWASRPAAAPVSEQPVERQELSDADILRLRDAIHQGDGGDQWDIAVARAAIAADRGQV